MAKEDVHQIIEKELKGIWTDYFDLIRDDHENEIKTEEKQCEVATTLFIQHCRVLERVGYFNDLPRGNDIKTASDMLKNPAPKNSKPAPNEMATKPQIDYIVRLCLGDNDRIESIKKQFQVTKLEELCKQAASQVIEELRIQNAEKGQRRD